MQGGDSMNGEASLSENALREVLKAVTSQANVPDSLPAPAYAYRLGQINGFLVGIDRAMKITPEERKRRGT